MGKKAKAGQILGSFNIDYIKAHHLDPTVVVLVINSKDYKNVETVDGAVESGKEIIAIQTEVPVDANLSVQ